MFLIMLARFLSVQSYLKWVTSDKFAKEYEEKSLKFEFWIKAEY